MSKKDGSTTVSVRLSREDRELLEQYAVAADVPGLMRIDGTPKISAILRRAAVRYARQTVRLADVVKEGTA